MYQLEKDEGSEFSASIVQVPPTTSKMSLTAQQLVSFVSIKIRKQIVFFSMISKLVCVVHNQLVFLKILR
jgi:hypothetical protein